MTVATSFRHERNGWRKVTPEKPGKGAVALPDLRSLGLYQPVILVADDDPLIRNLVTFLLQHDGYFVMSAADGHEGLHLSRIYQGVIDLLITDMEMPRMNGTDLRGHLMVGEATPDPKVEPWKEASQAVLVEFLRTDLDLAFAFLAIAKRESAYNPDHRDLVLINVRATLQVIKKFQGRIEDRHHWSEINVRAGQLEAALSGFNSSN